MSECDYDKTNRSQTTAPLAFYAHNLHSTLGRALSALCSAHPYFISLVLYRTLTILYKLREISSIFWQ